jgi:transcriptional regulator with XRE-family HTH domain
MRKVAEPEAAIGVRIAAARKRVNLSPTKIHELTGISRAVLRNYEIGKYKPGARELRRLCDVLGVSPNELIYGTVNPFRPPDPFEIPDGQEFNEQAVSQLAPAIAGVLLLFYGLAREDREALLRLAMTLYSSTHGHQGLAELDRRASAISTALLSQVKNLNHVVALATIDPVLQSLSSASPKSPSAGSPASTAPGRPARRRPR